MSVRTAVIPAAGLGTRFLPATKVVPKELLPVVDKPALQYIVEEAARAGIEDVHNVAVLVVPPLAACKHEPAQRNGGAASSLG